MDTLHQNEAARSPPWAGAAQALQTRMNNKDLMNSTLAPVLKSVNARDASSLQYLISWMGNSNASWIDTLPMLKLLLYCFPAQETAFRVDKLDAQFVRGYYRPTEGTLKMHWYKATPADFKPRFNIMAVTLAAYVDIVRGVDPLLSGNSEASNGRTFTTHRMDKTWTAVPIDSSLISQPYLLAYIMAYLPSYAWAGRSCYYWNAEHFDCKDSTKKYKTWFSAMPCSHNVSIPGFENIRLVLIEDSNHARSPHFDVPGVTASKAVSILVPG